MDLRRQRSILGDDILGRLFPGKSEGGISHCSLKSVDECVGEEVSQGLGGIYFGAFLQRKVKAVPTHCNTNEVKLLSGEVLVVEVQTTVQKLLSVQLLNFEFLADCSFSRFLGGGGS